jgi:hypothetical protein
MPPVGSQNTKKNPTFPREFDKRSLVLKTQSRWFAVATLLSSLVLSVRVRKDSSGCVRIAVIRRVSFL